MQKSTTSFVEYFIKNSGFETQAGLFLRTEGLRSKQLMTVLQLFLLLRDGGFLLFHIEYKEVIISLLDSSFNMRCSLIINVKELVSISASRSRNPVLWSIYQPCWFFTVSLQKYRVLSWLKKQTARRRYSTWGCFLYFLLVFIFTQIILPVLGPDLNWFSERFVSITLWLCR